MARDDHLHQRLLEWAQAVTVGDGSGYPTMSVLHEDWTPPSPGITPSLKTSPHSHARQTHRIIAQMSKRMQDTLTLHYCFPGLSLDEQALRLDCGVSALHKRIELAHRLLRSWVDAEARLTQRKAALGSAAPGADAAAEAGVFDTSTL